jgi:hypothetical protein
MTEDKAKKVAEKFRVVGWNIFAQQSPMERVGWELVGAAADGGKPFYAFNAADMHLLAYEGKIARLPTNQEIDEQTTGVTTAETEMTTKVSLTVNGELVSIGYNSGKREFSAGFRMSELLEVNRFENYAEGTWTLCLGLVRGTVYSETRHVGNKEGIDELYVKVTDAWAAHLQNGAQ